MSNILEIFDKNFTTYTAIISVISILLLYFIFRHIFKHSSNLKVFFLSIIVYVFVAGIGITIYYVSKNEYIFSSAEKYYLSGRVTKVGEDIIEVNVTDSTLSSISKGKVKIRLTKNTIYTIYSNSIDTKVELDDINSSSNVEIICKVSEKNNNEVIALKVTKIIY